MGRFKFKDEQDYERVRMEAEKFYVTIGKVRCPYFACDVVFNSKGMRHLKFKANRQSRSHKDQYSRLKLVNIAPEILRLSRTVQDIWIIKRFEEQKINKRWEKILKEVSYYEFIAVLNSIRVKVIVNEVAGGEKHFWSVIPFWRKDKNISILGLQSDNTEYD